MNDKMPVNLTPQLATLVTAVPENFEEWCYEIKFDGYRLLTFIHQNKIKLMTRNKHNWSDKFPSILKQFAHFKLNSAIFDGELVALDKKGISKFQLLQNAIAYSKSAHIVYYVFDFLYYNGQDLRNLSLVERKSLLKKVLKPFHSSSIQYSEVFQGDAAILLKKACKNSFEGLIAKQMHSPYENKRTQTWLKLKCVHEQELIIVGFTKPSGSREFFGALLVAYYDNKKQLHYAGKVGTGFTQTLLKDLYAKMQKIQIKKNKFYEFPDIPEIRQAFFTKPILVAEVKFTEWTKDNRLRHPVFLGIRLDKKAIDVRKE